MIYLFLNFLLLIHPIYISSTNVVINDDKLEIKVKLFRDDLEDGLRDFHGFSISIDSPKKIEKCLQRFHLLHISRQSQANSSSILYIQTPDQPLQWPVEFKN